MLHRCRRMRCFQEAACIGQPISSGRLACTGPARDRSQAVRGSSGVVCAAVLSHNACMRPWGPCRDAVVAYIEECEERFALDDEARGAGIDIGIGQNACPSVLLYHPTGHTAVVRPALVLPCSRRCTGCAPGWVGRPKRVLGRPWQQVCRAVIDWCLAERGVLHACTTGPCEFTGAPVDGHRLGSPLHFELIGLHLFVACSADRARQSVSDEAGRCW